MPNKQETTAGARARALGYHRILFCFGLKLIAVCFNLARLFPCYFVNPRIDYLPIGFGEGYRGVSRIIPLLSSCLCLSCSLESRVVVVVVVVMVVVGQ